MYIQYKKGTVNVHYYKSALKYVNNKKKTIGIKEIIKLHKEYTQSHIIIYTKKL